jgi:2-polyprenyl-6-methoxyphenol hydroxylase-like FAD-dependent oxidoreductase
MRVVVVGAGPAGAALSLLLARAGIEVRLIDRETSPERVFRGEGMMPLGLAALEQMDLDWDIDEIPGRLVSTWRILIDGYEVLTIPEPAEELGTLAFRVASPSALLERLIAEADRAASFTFHPGTRLADVLRVGDRVSGVQVVDADGAHEWPADLVVGCDGRGSSVRTRAGLTLTNIGEQYDVLWWKVPPPTSLAGTTDFRIMVRAGAHPLIAYTSWDDHIQCGLIMPKGGLAAVAGDGWLDRALVAAPDAFGAHVRAHSAQITGPIRLNVLVGRAPSWTVPGVLVLGDAAHPMSPVRAQGINLALRDAVVAANHLVPLVDGSPDTARIDAACRAIQAEREPEIVRAQTLQRREAQGQGDARAGSWRYTLAKRGAQALGRYHWAQRAWLARQHDLRFGSVDVRLTAPGAHRTPTS